MGTVKLLRVALIGESLEFRSLVRKGEGDFEVTVIFRLVMVQRALSKLSKPLQGFKNLRYLLAAFRGLLAEAGGDGFRVRAVSGEEFLDGGELCGNAARPRQGGGGCSGFREFGGLGAGK